MPRRLFADPSEVSADNIYADLALPEGPNGRPYVVLNMVSTVDGKIAIAGRAAGIGSSVDRTVMRQVRAAVDAVMVGAGTIRAEKVDPGVPAALARARQERGLPPQPLAVTLSRNLELEPTNRFFGAGPRLCCLLTTRSASPARAAAFADSAQVERVGERDVDLVAALAMLRSGYGVRRMVVEGGPTLNQALLEHGLIDELFWTIAPKLVGGHGPGLLNGPRAAEGIASELALVSLHEHAGELFARYRRR